MPNTVRKPTSEPSEMTRSPKVGGQHSTHQSRGQGQEDDRGQPPAGEGGLQQQEDADGRGDTEAEQPLLRALPLGELTE